MMRFLNKIIAVLSLAGLCACVSSAQVRQYMVKVQQQYPHDVTSFTQGLFFDEGQLYESTGLYGMSTFRKVDLATGKALRKLDFSDKYFVEGSVTLGDSLYILTWTSRVAFIYDKNTLEYIATRSYPRAGWGLTTDGESLIASDGSSRLYFMDKELRVKKTLNVKLHGKPLKYLNELEYIDGKIWANVYTTGMIVIIDPQTGLTEAVVDCSGLLPARLRTSETDVLNGIAHNSITGKTYITGKKWPLLFEITLEEK